MKKLLCLILSILLLAGLCSCKDGSTPTTAPSTTPLISPTGPLYDRASYTVSDSDAIAAHDFEVMKVGGTPIKNGLFQFSYWLEGFSFMDTYGTYAAALGLNFFKPLDQQICNGTTYTWQQRFIRDTVDSLHDCVALYLAYEEADLELPDALVKELDKLDENLANNAKDNGFNTVEEYLLAFYGPGVTAEDFYAYMRMAYLGDLYYNYRVSQIEVTEEKINDYFNRNETELSYSGIVKDGSLLYHVRHILLRVEDFSPIENATREDLTAEDWEKCRVAAENLLDEWLAGDATQATFGELARKHSKDSDSADFGGLYEACTQSSNFASEFRDWYLAEGRKAGDYGIVKTEAGYHLMYHVATEEDWHYKCGQAVFNTAVDQIIVDVTAAYPIEVDYSMISLGIATATIETSEEE